MKRRTKGKPKCGRRYCRFLQNKNETEGMEKYDILSGAAVESGGLKGAAAKE